MAKLYLFEVVVAPLNKWSPFPLDMLRRDCLYPAKENEIGSIHQYLSEFSDRGHVDNPVTLQGVHHKEWIPTLARWISFGWTVKTSVLLKEATV